MLVLLMEVLKLKLRVRRVLLCESFDRRRTLSVDKGDSLSITLFRMLCHFNMN